MKYLHFQYEIHLHSGSVTFSSYLLLPQRVTCFFFWWMPTEPPPATFLLGSTWYGGRSTSSTLGSPCPSQQEKSLAVDRFFGGLQTDSSPLTALRKDDFIHPTFTKNGTVVDSEIWLFFHRDVEPKNRKSWDKLSSSTGEPEFWTTSNIGTETCLFWFLESYLENQVYHESHPHVMNFFISFFTPPKMQGTPDSLPLAGPFLERYGRGAGAPEAQRVLHDVFWGVEGPLLYGSLMVMSQN